MSKKQKNVLILVVVLVLVFVLYSFFLKGSSEEDLARTGGDPETQIVEAEILTLLNTLNRIDFNTELFDSPEYLSLIDFSIELEPEPQGRPNPFSPIGIDRETEPQSEARSETLEDVTAPTTTEDQTPPPTTFEDDLSELEDDFGLDEFGNF